MRQLRIAAAQMRIEADIAANAACISRAIDFAAEEGADILLTPEASLSAYTHDFDQSACRSHLEQLCRQAADKNIGLALGTCFYEAENNCYNQIRFYNKSGEYLGFHSKILTCGAVREPYQGEYDYYRSTALRVFDFHGVTIGGLVCNDFWGNPMCTRQDDPHLTVRLRELGCQVIFHAVNCGRKNDGDWYRMVWDFHGSNLRMRTRAADLWTVTVNRQENSEGEIGPVSQSGVLDPKGNWVYQSADQGEVFFTYDIALV